MDSQQTISAIEISDWIFRYLNNTLSEDQRTALNTWREVSPANEALFVELTNTEYLKGALSERQGFDAHQVWSALDKKLAKRPSAKRVRFSSMPLLRIAAFVVVLLSLAVWIQTSLKRPSTQTVEMAQDAILPGGSRATLTLEDGTNVVLDSVKDGDLSFVAKADVSKSEGRLFYRESPQSGPTSYHTITTPKGGHYKLVLSDGSRVWLNAASSIRYPIYFSDSSRNVDISGEAYFEVEKSSDRPFRVHIPDSTIVEVLGTAFNINAYSDEQKINTTLFEGSVELISKAGGRVRLKPGQQAQLDGAIRVTDDINPEEVIAWKEGLFYFNRADIRTIMRQVSRWYDVEIVYEGIPDRKTFSGMVSRSNDISQVLLIMERAGVGFRIEGRKVYVLSNQ